MVLQTKNTQKVEIAEKTVFYEFLKNRIFRKLTTDFENCTRYIQIVSHIGITFGTCQFTGLICIVVCSNR